MSDTVVLGEEEVVLLTQLLELPQAPMSIDPTAAEQVEAALVAAGHALTARGLLTLHGDGSVDVEPSVAALLETCGRPVVSFVVTARMPGHEEQRSAFHVSESAVVRQTFPADGVQSFGTLTPDHLAQQLAEALHLDDESAPACAPVELSHRHVLAAAMSVAPGDYAAGVQMLEQAGADSECAARLAATMHTVRVNGALAWVHTASNVGDGFATLAGDNDLWLLEPSPLPDSDAVTARPTSARQVRAQLADLCTSVCAR